MNLPTLLLLSLSLAMDAFTVSLAKGMGLKNNIKKQAFVIALTFGLFQAVMPLIGWFAGTYFENLIKSIDHWIAFGLLAAIGFKMIIEAVSSHEDEEDEEATISFRHLITLGIATSIDALAVGISFSLLDVNIWYAIILIGAITFILCFIGVNMAHKVGKNFGKYAEMAGGIILFLIGLGILIEHMFL